jgi:hypothetical protein
MSCCSGTEVGLCQQQGGAQQQHGPHAAALTIMVV